MIIPHTQMHWTESFHGLTVFQIIFQIYYCETTDGKLYTHQSNPTIVFTIFFQSVPIICTFVADP